MSVVHSGSGVQSSHCAQFVRLRISKNRNKKALFMAKVYKVNVGIISKCVGVVHLQAAKA